MRGCQLIGAYEAIQYQTNNGGLGKAPSSDKDKPDDWKIQTVLQVKF